MTKPDLSLLDGVVAPKILEAMRLASAALKRIQVRHTLVGGLAIGAYGSPRATKDVDFLVGDEAFERHEGGLVTLKSGVPIQVEGVPIDLLSIGAGESHLEAALTDEIAPAPALVYLKLKSPRSRDRSDVIEMIKAGLDEHSVRSYLAAHGPSLVAAFDDAVSTARAEENA